MSVPSDSLPGAPGDAGALTCAGAREGDVLDHALQAWVAPVLPDDGFTAAVLRRVAASRARTGLAPAEALRRLQVQRQRDARQARWTVPGLLMGVTVAVAWLLAGNPAAVGAVAGSWPWMLWLGAALAGTAGALAWLAQQAD